MAESILSCRCCGFNSFRFEESQLVRVAQVGDYFRSLRLFPTPLGWEFILKEADQPIPLEKRDESDFDDKGVILVRTPTYNGRRNGVSNNRWMED